MKCNIKVISLFSEEDGVVLIMSLLIMVLLTLLGNAAIQTGTIDVMIADNYKDSVQALYAAEAGIEKVWDAFKQGDTDGDGFVTAGTDTANQGNDLDGNGGGTIDFIQAFTNKTNIMSPACAAPCTCSSTTSDGDRVTVNANTIYQAYICVDASNAPNNVIIYSTGNPSGSAARRKLSLSFSTSAAALINGALNNAP